MKAAPLLRALVLLLLAAALVLPGVWRDPAAMPATFRVRDATTPAEIARAATGGVPPTLIVRATTRAPSAAELEALAAASERAPLVAALPAGSPAVAVDPPARPLAGRAAALVFHLRDAARDSVLVRLSEGGSVIDSARVRTNAAGRASGAFRVRPPRSGWREWSVEMGGARGRTGAWVDSAGAPRVLVRAGMPGWEAKFAVRALEESGARVDVRYDLGRGLGVVQGSGAAITTAALAPFDAVVVLDGAPLSGGEAAALADFAASRGGGVLLAGDRAGALGVVRGRSATVPVDGSLVFWSAPAELAPLPGVRVRASAVPFAALATGTTLAASTAQGGVFAVRPLGRGRAAALALTDTWRWRMEAGEVDGHRAFWRGVVDWLASAPRGGATVRVEPAIGEVGARQDVAVYAAGDPPPHLLLARPGGGTDTLPLRADRRGVLRASFVPAREGVHTLALPGGAIAAAFRAASGAEGAWARLTILAHRSGGTAVPESALARVVAERAGASGNAPPGLPPRWLLLIALIVLAGAEWAIRRFSGQP